MSLDREYFTAIIPISDFRSVALPVVRRVYLGNGQTHAATDESDQAGEHDRHIKEVALRLQGKTEIMKLPGQNRHLQSVRWYRWLLDSQPLQGLSVQVVFLPAAG